ncbi:hypothetical protein [Hydrogenimonas sp.]|uniref:hypothetical protein n=1 Tax=Hydrogenimonas sp. TaxID=2231112 RepID=UPI0026258C70|nr:hypothetical protein [Hydrogenimonas sp.]
MMEFLKKATEWVLDKEEQAAQKCKIDLEDLQKQIDLILSKREKLQKECEENLAELDHILKRLETIKAKEESCQR